MIKTIVICRIIWNVFFFFFFLIAINILDIWLRWEYNYRCQILRQFVEAKELDKVPWKERKAQRRLNFLKGAGSLLKTENTLSRFVLPVTRDPFTSTLKTRSSLRRTLIADSLPNGVAAGRHSSFFFRRSLSDGSAYYLATGPSVLVGVDGHAHRTSLDILYF